MTLPLRARLTWWYVAVLAMVLIGFSTGVLLLQSRFSRSQFDQELSTLATAVTTSLRAELAESHDLRHASRETREDFNIPNLTIAILDGDGHPVAAHWRGFRRSDLPRGGTGVTIATLPQDHQTWRVRLERHDSPDGPFTVFVAASESALIREQHLLAKALLVGMPVALLFAALVCWWAASRALQPVTAMSDQAERITLQSLDTRLSGWDADDEVGQLRRAFNRLLDRVAAGVTAQRRFTADASHELRTPVTAVRTAAEITLSKPQRTEDEYRDALGIVLAQSERLGHMVEDMLMLARADAGGFQLRRHVGSLSDAIEQAVDTALVLATKKRLTVEAFIAPDVTCVADDILIRQLALNLLDNAIKHTPDGGRVTVSLTVVDDVAEMIVSDTGCGIAWSERERIFDRFVRLDEARTDTGGAGLGLSIARWIAESHYGTVTLEETGASGSTFVVRLPLSHPAAEKSTPIARRAWTAYASRVAASNPAVASEPR
jgi:heavy metal sensor kinase